MAAFVVLAVAIVLASVYLIGDGGSTAEAYDRASEHGQFTSFVYRDLTGVDLDARLAGLDVNLDPDIRIVLEHGAFTPLVVRDLSGVDLNRLAGLDANFDRDVILGAGYHTLMPANWGDVDIGVRFAGLDTSASVVVQVEPDALARFLTSNRPTGPEADAVDRYLANN
ncbi:MAG: hypothetical protein OER12_10915 [Acidimicrobiia bacterium]|nr:hypothetical protein [Acidimicrobiia bacterium]